MSSQVRHVSWIESLANKHLLWLRLGVIAGILFAVASSGFVVSKGRIDPVMILAGALAALSMLIWDRFGRFEHGILGTLLAAGLLNFFTIPTGTESRIVVSLVIALGLTGLWLVQMLVIQKKVQIKPAPVNKPILSFVAVSVVAYGWSTLLRDPLVFVPSSFPVTQAAALMVNILLPMLVLLVSNKIEDTRWLRWLTWIVIGLGTLRIISVLFSLPTGILIDNGSRGLFTMWVGAMAYSMALFDEELSRLKRVLLLVLLTGLLYYYFVKNDLWLSGWLPLGIACVVITLARSRRLFILVSVLGLIYFGVNFDKYYQEIYVGNMNEGSGQRVDLWATNLDLVAKHPLFGVGPAGYAVYYMTYHPDNARSTHNNYFDVVAQTGVIGFGIFLWMFATFVRIGNQVRRRSLGQRNFHEAFANATLAGCIGALAGMMLGDWVLPFAYNQTISGFDNAAFTWVLLGGMVSLYHIQNARAATHPVSPT
jgi:hypothetical protein